MFDLAIEVRPQTIKRWNINKKLTTGSHFFDNFRNRPRVICNVFENIK